MIATTRALAALTILALAPTPARANGNVVQAEEFVLRDHQGNVVGALSAGEGERPSLVLYDRDGTVRLVLEATPDGSPALTLAGDEGGYDVPLGIVSQLLSPLTSRDLVDWPGALRLQLGPELRESLVPRLPYGAAILAVAVLATTALVLLVALILLERRAVRSTRQFQELWASVMEDRERERAAFRDSLVSHRNSADAQLEALERCADVGADVARTLERVRGEIDQQLRRLRR